MAKPKNTGGRPIEYSSALGDDICLKLMSGISLLEMCKADTMPGRSTVHNWLVRGERDKQEKLDTDLARFLDSYVRAREIQGDTIFDEILEVADDGQNDWMERFGRDGESIGWVVNGEAVQRSRLRVDARFKMAGQLNPKKYGNKMDVTSNGEKLPSPAVATVAPEVLAEAMKQFKGSL